MSLSFDGVDDIVNSAADQTLGTLVTLHAWAKPTTYGENNTAWLVAHDAGGASEGVVRVLLRLDNSSSVQTFGGSVSRTAAPHGLWRAPTNLLAGLLGTWHAFAMTMDLVAIANVPKFYLDGQPVATTTVTQPTGASGAIRPDVQPIRIGNANALSRTMDGLIGDVAVWTRILSDAEIAAVWALGVMAVPDPLIYLPLDSGRTQSLGASGVGFTVTGALADENPPCRPAGRRG